MNHLDILKSMQFFVVGRGVISIYEKMGSLIKFADFIIFKKLWLPIYLNI
jgi:hypothetical protein